MRARVRWQDFLLPAVFLSALALVLLCTDWSGRNNRVAALENRKPAPWPALPHDAEELAAYPGRFGAFFADHFGLRPELVAIRARLGRILLKKSISPLVIVGSHGWLFYSGSQLVENHLHEIPFSAAELDEWAKRLRERERWFAAHGVKYLFVVAPDKASIYPQHLPEALVPSPGRTRLDQLDRVFANDPNWLDLRPALHAAAREGLAYFLGDTHWNDFGAYHGYRASMRRLGLPALPRDPARLTKIRSPVDLARLSGVPRTEPNTEYRPACDEKRPSTFDPANFHSRESVPPYKIPATVCPTGHGRLVIFQDSFSLALSPYLSDSFGRVVYVWHEPTLAEMQAVVAVEHPSVVIEERVERFLILPLRR